MKASDEKASRCDHANGNQYTHLWLWSRVWGNEIPIKLQGRQNPVGVFVGHCETCSKNDCFIYKPIYIKKGKE